jgi:MerR family copper efflux transcriptional regulator
MDRLSNPLPLIACSLDATGQEARLAEWQELLGQAASREETPDGARFTFVADERDEQRIRELAAAEHECCAFLEFDVTRREDQVVMSVTTRPDALDALRFVFSG